MEKEASGKKSPGKRDNEFKTVAQIGPSILREGTSTGTLRENYGTSTKVSPIHVLNISLLSSSPTTVKTQQVKNGHGVRGKKAVS